MMTLLDSIYLHRYRLFVSPVEELRLPEFKGSALRGVFGHALRRVACVIPDEECNRCALRGSCAYAVLFESMPSDSFPDAGKYRNFPRPYVINPPLSRQTLYRPGEQLVFDLVLVGRAVECLPHVLLAFESIGQSGFSAGRGRFALSAVESIEANGYSLPIYQNGTLYGAGSPVTFRYERAVGNPIGAVSVHFLTPARIEVNGKLQDGAPPFQFLMRLLGQRLSLLTALYCRDGAAAFNPGDDFFTLAEKVRLIDAQLSWQEHERYSSRQQSRMRQGGIVGSAVYHGPVGRYLPYLKIMEHLNIGKSTTFGLGRIALSCG